MLSTILRGSEEAIAERWIELVFERYAKETMAFLARERDGFSNPVGRMFRDAGRPLARALAEDRPDQGLFEDMCELMRLRSVQDMTAAEAVGIVPLLRTAVMDVVGRRIEAEGCGVMGELGRRIERLMLISFDAFVMSRERLYEVRMAERERHTASLLRRAERVLAGSGRAETGCGSQRGGPAAGR